MKALALFLALACVASASHMIDIPLTNLMQAGYAVDTVVELLVALARTTGAHTQDLIDNWAITEASLEANIAGIQELDDAQHQHCASIDADAEALRVEIARYQDYIAEAKDHIKTNEDTLAARLEARCTTNIAFIEKLKDNQDAAKLLHFLRDQVADPGFAAYLSASNGALIELRKSHKHQMLSMIAKHHMLSVLQQYQGEDSLGYNTNARTEEEIGNGHVDNSKGALDVDHWVSDSRDLDDFIAELLQHIDDLINALHDENANLRDTEFAAVENLIDYQDKVEHENLILHSYIGQWSDKVDELTTTLEQTEDASATCHARADELDGQLADAQDDLAAKTQAFETKRDSLLNTLATLEAVIQLYVDKVAGASEVYKQRIDRELEAARPHDVSADEVVAPEPEIHRLGENGAGIWHPPAAEEEEQYFNVGGPDSIPPWMRNPQPAEEEGEQEGELRYEEPIEVRYEEPTQEIHYDYSPETYQEPIHRVGENGAGIWHGYEEAEEQTHIVGGPGSYPPWLGNEEGGEAEAELEGIRPIDQEIDGGPGSLPPWAGQNDIPIGDDGINPADLAPAEEEEQYYVVGGPGSLPPWVTHAAEEEVQGELEEVHYEPEPLRYDSVTQTDAPTHQEENTVIVGQNGAGVWHGYDDQPVGDDGINPEDEPVQAADPRTDANNNLADQGIVDDASPFGPEPAGDDQ